MNISQKILSDITVFMKYAKFQPEKNRRETWEELVTRNKEMHQRKYPHIKDLSFDTTENIERILSDINEQLPEDIRMTYQYENFKGELVDIPRRIRRDHYVMQ